jgi:hypothetical protein
MGASYVVLLTAFYVDNGKNLPLWRELPPIAFWILPSAVGAPIMAFALLRHRLEAEAKAIAAAEPATRSGIFVNEIHPIRYAFDRAAGRSVWPPAP